MPKSFCISLMYSEKLVEADELPEEERNFQRIYREAPSFLSIHMGVKASVLPPDTDCHHFILEVCRSFCPCYIYGVQKHSLKSGEVAKRSAFPLSLSGSYTSFMFLGQWSLVKTIVFV